MPSLHPPVSFFPAAVALLVGLGLSAALFFDLRELQRNAADSEFERQANIRVHVIERELRDTESVLRVLNQLFAAVESVSRAQFSHFTQPMLERFPYIQAFNLHRFVEGGERAAFEAGFQEVLPGYVITQLKDGVPVPAPESERYLVIDYIAPFAGNEVALGLNVWPNAHLAEVVQRAVDTGEPQATGLVPLAQDGGRRLGFLLVMPVYRHGATLHDVASRRQAAIGDTAAVFKAGDVIERILAADGLRAESDLAIRVYAGSSRDASGLVYSSGDPPAAAGPAWLALTKPQTVEREFELAGLPWRIVVENRPVSLWGGGGAALFSLVGGILLSLLLAAYVQMLVFRSRKVEALVRERTAELEFRANRDTLTGLANRNLLQDRLQQALLYASRSGLAVWVLFINLDRFKFVNDTLGHRAGDMLLQTVAQRLRRAVREGDTVARLSADEFVLVLSERSDAPLAAVAVQRVMKAIAEPAVIDGYEFVMGCCVGVAVAPADGSDPDSLIKHAGIAMYRTKEQARNSFQFFTAAMNEQAMERLRLESDLRNALERGEFVLHYQPQVAIADGRVLGVEALLRWNHPALGLVSPARFVSLAEETGLIVPLGNWVLRQACAQVVAWQAAGLAPIQVAVNLSARQFYQHDLVRTIAAALADSGLAPHQLELELTESMMMADVEQAAAILVELKGLGVQLSIDDFGTGYSSLAYLKRFPIDALKIDRSFVSDIMADTDNAAIVLSIISLAHSLRLHVIAEGVETTAQLDYLRQHGCDHAQGYLFSRPLDAQACQHLLKRVGRLPEQDIAGLAAVS